jgi:pimeloyl-ACP methyl ester carboxylesterase/ubiquinone/menaquinone biosynthesis C-methylase UbiE
VSSEKIVKANGVDICVQTFGETEDPTVLLIAGLASSMDWWETEFCERLAAAGRFVIRYDHRDTGRSIGYPPGYPGYSSADLVDDAAGVLASLDRPSAHVVGISMGGAIAQLLALSYPNSVDSLTLISTTAGPGDADLPHPSAELSAYFSNPAPDPDWSDHAAVVEHIVDECRHYAAPSQAYDDAAIRAVAARAIGRTTNVESSQTNHALAGGGEPWRERLGEITAPTVVLHGTEDPLFPFGHGAALAREIPGAQLVPLDHTGHELPQRVWDVVLAAVIAFSSPDWSQRADRLAATAVAAGEPTAWFERLYAGALRGQSAMPWDRSDPNQLLSQWSSERSLSGSGKRALVVGCGLGADAEYVAALGFRTTAFDVSESAISIARARHPDSPVDYRTADALHLPAEWRRAFDLVVEIYTVQALPLSLRRDVIAAVADLVADGGTLIVIQAARRDLAEPPDGPPWPLHRTEIDLFAAEGLRPVMVELIDASWSHLGGHWRAEFTRPNPATIAD